MEDDGVGLSEHAAMGSGSYKHIWGAEFFSLRKATGGNLQASHRSASVRSVKTKFASPHRLDYIQSYYASFSFSQSSASTGSFQVSTADGFNPARRSPTVTNASMPGSDLSFPSFSLPTRALYSSTSFSVNTSAPCTFAIRYLSLASPPYLTGYGSALLHQ